ncbi:MAG: TetR/AcrR family transcriptional regulator [Burkholderiaceae bacterium]
MSSGSFQPRISATLAERNQARSQETRGRLVAAAIDCLSERGYSGATTPLIAKRAGVTRGALQHHFASRTDLDVAVIDFVSEALNFSLDVDALKDAPLAERVAHLVDAYWSTFGGKLFRAALHIWLAVLHDEALAQRMSEQLFALQERIEPLWRALFHDVGLSTRELRTLRHVVMGAARGYAVERLITGTGAGAPERKMLIRMTLRELQFVAKTARTQAALACVDLPGGEEG